MRKERSPLSAEQLRQKYQAIHADRKDLHWAKRLQLACSELGEDLFLAILERDAARALADDRERDLAPYEAEIFALRKERDERTRLLTDIWRTIALPVDSALYRRLEALLGPPPPLDL